MRLKTKAEKIQTTNEEKANRTTVGGNEPTSRTIMCVKSVNCRIRVKISTTYFRATPHTCVWKEQPNKDLFWFW